MSLRWPRGQWVQRSLAPGTYGLPRSAVPWLLPGTTGLSSLRARLRRGRFHATLATYDLLRQFSSLGVNAKLSDDVVNFSPDFEEGRPYLLLVLAEEDEREYKRLSARLRPENR